MSFERQDDAACDFGRDVRHLRVAASDLEDALFQILSELESGRRMVPAGPMRKAARSAKISLGALLEGVDALSEVLAHDPLARLCSAQRLTRQQFYLAAAQGFLVPGDSFEAFDALYYQDSQREGYIDPWGRGEETRGPFWLGPEQVDPSQIDRAQLAVIGIRHPLLYQALMTRAEQLSAERT